MNKEHGRRDDTSSESQRDFFGTKGDASDIVVSDKDIENALSRLQARVEAEEASPLWTNMEAGSGKDHEGVSESVSPLRMVAGPSASMNDGTPSQGVVEGSGGSSSNAGNSNTNAENSKTKSRHKASPRGRRTKIAWTAAAAVVVVGTLVSPLGGKAMAAAMQTFYFHNVVGVGQDDMSQIQNALQSVSQGNTTGTQQIDLKQYGSVDVSGGTNGYQNNLTLDEANKLTSFQIQTLPGFDPSKDRLSYSPGQEVTFRLNVPAINNLIKRLGGKALLPSEVNGEPITVNVPPQVFQNVQGKNANGNMSLSEMKMPTVQVPGNVDMNQVKQALLGLPFLPDDIRRSLETSSNWQETLYVPTNGKVTNLTINGNPAVLQTWPNGQERSMLWLENGILYQLQGSPDAFPTDNSIVSTAKGLS